MSGREQGEAKARVGELRVESQGDVIYDERIGYMADAL